MTLRINNTIQMFIAFSSHKQHFKQTNIYTIYASTIFGLSIFQVFLNIKTYTIHIYSHNKITVLSFISRGYIAYSISVQYNTTYAASSGRHVKRIAYTLGMLQVNRLPFSE